VTLNPKDDVPLGSTGFVGTLKVSGRPPVSVLARVRVRDLRVRLTPLALLSVLATELEREGLNGLSTDECTPAGEAGVAMIVAKDTGGDVCSR
jgi:hypothetical protein